MDKCYLCGCSDKLLFKDSEDGEDKYICIDDRNKKMLNQLGVEQINSDDYICKWRLKNDKGETRVESFVCSGIDDFGRISGDITDKILWVTLRQRGQAMF